MSKKQRKHTFHYIKTNDYSTHLTTGVYGGINVQGLINMYLYNDRAPIPKKLTYKVDKGRLGDLVKKKTKEDDIREVFCGITMDKITAQRIIEWLQEKVDLIEQLEKKQKEND